MSDHPGAEATFETWTLLTWLAAHTSNINLVTRVLGLPFRHPALLATMSASVVELAGSRLVLGLGAGGNEAELRRFGAPERSPGERIDDMDDAVQTIRAAWGDAEVSIPVWLGTFGPRALGVTGRLADGWIPTLGYASQDELRRMHDIIRSAAVVAGRAEDAVRAILNVRVSIGPDPSGDPNVVAGPAEAVAAQLATFVDDGFTGFNLLAEGSDDAKRFITDVLPLLPACAS
jgi:alkanesulfonate monooxygenase SsuD/methylene tetrahydromethanopterin reductase-like flavin-dependent oxidoreductase (luciferase family)